MNAKINFEYIKETASAGKVKGDLEACLNSRTKGALGEIAKVYGLEGISKMKKAELTDLVSKAILSDCQEKLAEVSTAERTTFENLCDCEVLPLEGLACEQLVKSGIAYVFSSKEEYSVTVPEELREITVEIFEGKLDFDRYISGAILLYGYVEVSFLARLIASFGEKREIEAEFKKYVEQASAYTNDYVLFEGHIIAKSLWENNSEKLTKLKSIIDGEPIFKPTKEIFDVYCDGKFEINSQIKKLTDFAYKYVTANLGDAQRIVGIIVNEHRSATTYAIERYESKFAANGYKFTTVQVEAKVVSLIVEVINSVRLWAYRGYTATEKKELLMGMKMKAAKRPVAPITTVNIGRNDPCPCGSGKKYKKCCGK